MSEANEVDGVVMPGDVWRKAGPCGWVKVLRVQMPHNKNYDGGAKGCSVKFTNINGNWERKSFFILANDSADFERQMIDGFRRRA